MTRRHVLGHYIEPLAGHWWVLGPTRRFGPYASEAAARDGLARILRDHRKLRRSVVFK